MEPVQGTGVGAEWREEVGNLAVSQSAKTGKSKLTSTSVVVISRSVVIGVIVTPVVIRICIKRQERERVSVCVNGLSLLWHKQILPDEDEATDTKLTMIGGSLAGVGSTGGVVMVSLAIGSRRHG